jgi:hypothetical protein
VVLWCVAVFTPAATLVDLGSFRYLLLLQIISNLDASRSRTSADSRVFLYFTSESYLHAFKNILLHSKIASNAVGMMNTHLLMYDQLLLSKLCSQRQDYFLRLTFRFTLCIWSTSLSVSPQSSGRVFFFFSWTHLMYFFNTTHNEISHAPMAEAARNSKRLVFFNFISPVGNCFSNLSVLTNQMLFFVSGCVDVSDVRCVKACCVLMCLTFCCGCLSVLCVDVFDVLLWMFKRVVC